MARVTITVKMHRNVIRNLINDMDVKTEKVSTTLRDMTKNSMGTSGFPKIRTGKLKGSLQSSKLGKGRYRVFTDVFYAGYVEFGTSRASPYPYLRPNVNKLKRMIPGIYEARKI